MNKQRRKPVEALRVPFNCNLAPTTKELITGIQNTTKESQGEIVDRAVALLALGEEVAPGSRKKPSRKEMAIQEREATDATAKAVEREDIDYSDLDSTPTTHVATLNAFGPPTSGPVGKVSIEKWRAHRKPLLKPKDR